MTPDELNNEGTCAVMQAGMLFFMYNLTVAGVILTFCVVYSFSPLGI